MATGSGSGLTFKQLQVEVGAWSRANFPNSTPRDPYEGVIEELGELAHARLKGRQGIRGTAAEHEAAEKDALADMLIFAANYCDRAGIDYADLVDDELEYHDIECDDRSIATIQEAIKHEDLYPGADEAFDDMTYRAGQFTYDKEMIGILTVSIFGYAVQRGFNLAVIVEETWNRVKLRNWRKDALNGGIDEAAPLVPAPAITEDITDHLVNYRDDIIWIPDYD